MTTERPSTWEQFVGQTALKHRLKIHITSVNERGGRLDHILLAGPPGSGKTSLAQVIANELGLPFKSHVMPISNSTVQRLMRSEKSVVLLDELHRCSKKEQEQFLTILEDGYLETPSGQKFTNHNLTFIGATTELSEIIPPLFDRFPIKPFLDEYTDLEMAQIVKRFAALSYLSLSDDDAVKLGKATGGVPRNAGSLIKMMHDMTYTLNRYPTIPEVLTECRVTEGGLTEYHQEYLRALRKSGGQAGLDTIGNYLRLPKTVVQDLEKLLLKKELIIYSKTGRQLSDQGWVTTEK